MKSITVVVNKNNRLDDITDPGPHNEGLLVNIYFQHTGETVYGVFTTTTGCLSCMFHTSERCPRVKGQVCIACAINGGYGICAIVNPEDMI
jgi:hypothetical protein